MGGERELPGEDFDLLGERGAAEAGEARVIGAGAVDDPAIEADFTDGGGGAGVEVGEEGALPIGGAVADVPRVQSVRRKKLRVERGGLSAGGAEGGDVGPVEFAAAVDNEAGDAGGLEIGEDAGAVGGEPSVLEMAVGVEERWHG